MPTPLLDKARSEELTSSEIQTALRELRTLAGADFAVRAELGTDTYKDCWVHVAGRGRDGDTIEDALCAWRDEIELEQAREEDPGTELAVKHGCTCTAPPARSTDIDPPEVRRSRTCPLHGEDE